MPVVAIDEDRSVGSDGINQLSCRQLSRRPLLLIPVSSGNPLAFGRLFCSLRDALSEFLRRGCVFQLNFLEMLSSIHKMDMSIVEAREKQAALSINHFCLGTVPDIHVSSRTHGNNPFPHNGQSLRLRARLIDSPYFCVCNDEIGRWFGLRGQVAATAN